MKKIYPHLIVLFVAAFLFPFTGISAGNMSGRPSNSKELAEKSGYNTNASAETKSGPGIRTITEIPPEGLLLIINSTNSNVMAFDPYSGDMIDEYFFPVSNGFLSTPIQITWNHDKTSFLISDQLRGVIQQFSPTGMFQKTFAPAGGEDTLIMSNNRGMMMQDDGSLWVTVAGGSNKNTIAVLILKVIIQATLLKMVQEISTVPGVSFIVLNLMII